MIDLAARVRKAIEATGETQAAVAARANLPVETVGRIVTRETRNPQVSTLMKLAPVLGVSVGWLLGETTAALTPWESHTLSEAIDILRSRLIGVPHDPRQSPNATPLPAGEIPREFAEQGATLVFRAEGDSMNGCGILPGDHLFVRPLEDLRQALGDVVICRVAKALYVKRLAVDETHIRLLSENESYGAIIVDETADDFALVGVVIARAGAL
ncbi:MAG TPA: XRE family transcriptional regulator [Thermoanaerobaculia bacterium]|jgi:SOS-response transcriptional repressor LexA